MHLANSQLYVLISIVCCAYILMWHYITYMQTILFETKTKMPPILLSQVTLMDFPCLFDILVHRIKLKENKNFLHFVHSFTTGSG